MYQKVMFKMVEGNSYIVPGNKRITFPDKINELVGVGGDLVPRLVQVTTEIRDSKPVLYVNVWKHEKEFYTDRIILDDADGKKQDG